jgi:hypothetical protein
MIDSIRFAVGTWKYNMNSKREGGTGQEKASRSENETDKFRVKFAKGGNWMSDQTLRYKADAN